MLSKEMILSLASKVMSPEKIQSLSQAFETTNSIVSAASNPQEALQKAGVTKEDLSKIKGYLNNPMASFLLKPLGLDITQAKEVIANIEKGSFPQTVGSSPQMTQGDDLDAMQKMLAQLK